MYITVFFLLLICVFLYLIFTIPVQLSFLFDSDEMDMHFSMTWLSLLKMKAKILQNRIHVSIFMFDKQITSKFMARQRGSDKTVLGVLRLQDTHIGIYYGLNEPYQTGLLFGALSFVRSLIKVDVFEQFPQFLSLNEYLRIEASSSLNIGMTAVNFIQLKSEQVKRRNHFGTVKFN